MTTPFEREVLTHHYVSNAPFPRLSALYFETALRFVRLGLLFPQGPNGFRPGPALAVYMEALAAVPLPVQKWVVPT